MNSTQTVKVEQAFHEAMRRVYGGMCLPVYSPFIADFWSLQPDKPDDGSTGFLAYDVGNDKPRMKMKTGRFLVRKLKLSDWPDSEIRALAEAINKALFPENCIQMLTGPAIMDAYRDCVGARSCMTGDNCSCVDLYSRNPKRFSLFVLSRNGDTGRAIVHKLDDDNLLMDRIYATSVDVVAEMRDHAKNQGWLCRHSCGAVYDSNDERVPNSRLCVSGLDWIDGGVPYMDTLHYGAVNDSKLDISANTGDFGLSSTEGYLGSHVCCNCGGHYSPDNMHDVGDDSYCSGCFYESFSYCDHCSGVCSVDDTIHIKDRDICVCDYCARNSYSLCDDCGLWKSESHTVDDGDSVICESCYENGDYAICCNCGELFSGRNVTHICGDDLCNDCRDDQYAQCPHCKQWVDSNAIVDGICPDCAADKMYAETTDTESEAA